MYTSLYYKPSSHRIGTFTVETLQLHVYPLCCIVFYKKYKEVRQNIVSSFASSSVSGIQRWISGYKAVGASGSSLNSYFRLKANRLICMLFSVLAPVTPFSSTTPTFCLVLRKLALTRIPDPIRPTRRAVNDDS